MEDIPIEILKEAKECAEENGHSELAEHLWEMFILYDMDSPSNVISRDTEIGGVANPKHVPAYYDAIDQLEQGGDTPQGNNYWRLFFLIWVVLQSDRRKRTIINMTKYLFV